MNNFENVLLTRTSADDSCTIFLNGTTDDKFIDDLQNQEDFNVVRSRHETIVYNQVKLIKVLKDKRNFSNIQNSILFIDDKTGKRVFQILISDDLKLAISEDIFVKIINQLSALDSDIKSIRIDFLMKLQFTNII